MNYNNNNNNSSSINDSTTVLGESSTTDSRRRRRRRRRRSSRSCTDDDDNNNGNPNDRIPWQAMKRLRVDGTIQASSMISTELVVDDSSSFHNNNNNINNNNNNNDVPNMHGPRTITIDSLTQLHTQLQEQIPSTNYKYDSYHCYQRHQQQETGQDTDGWSSPEQYTPPTSITHSLSSSSHHHHHHNNNTRTHPSTGRNSYTTPSVLHNSNNDNNNDDIDDDMDYQNVNHILGNLHFERQQRMVQSQQLLPPLTRQRRLLENSSWNINNSNDDSVLQPMNESHIHEPSVSSSTASNSNMTAVSSVSLTTLPPTPMNTRMVRQQQQYWNGSQQHLQPSSSSSQQYQTPPSKPTKRKVVQLYTNSKLG